MCAVMLLLGLSIVSVSCSTLRKDQRSVGWLAREIHCTRNNVYKIFNKPSLDSDLILRISNAMNFNFFQYYTIEFKQSLEKRIGEE